MNEHLSRDEIDTLLNGVNSGEVDTDLDRQAIDGEVIPYDLSSQDRVIRGRMSTLDMVNERFMRYLRVSMANMLRRPADISLLALKMVKYSEYVGNLLTPSNLNLININPLPGTGLFVNDPKLIFAMVESYFGGDGRYFTRIEGHEFTPTESRVIQLFLDLSFADLKKAWEPITRLNFKYLKSEINPQYANNISPSEIVVVSDFKMELGGGGGEFHIVMPYSMLEPLREQLDSGIQSSQADVDPHWLIALKNEMEQVVVEIDCSMAHTKLSLNDVLNFSAGDVIPVELSEFLTVRAADTPVFRGTLGVSNGKNAVRFVEPIRRLNYA